MDKTCVVNVTLRTGSAARLSRGSAARLCARRCAGGGRDVYIYGAAGRQRGRDVAARPHDDDKHRQARRERQAAEAAETPAAHRTQGAHAREAQTPRERSHAGAPRVDARRTARAPQSRVGNGRRCGHHVAQRTPPPAATRGGVEAPAVYRRKCSEEGAGKSSVRHPAHSMHKHGKSKHRRGKRAKSSARCWPRATGSKTRGAAGEKPRGKAGEKEGERAGGEVARPGWMEDGWREISRADWALCGGGAEL